MTLRSHTAQCLVWPRVCAPTLPSAWYGHDVALPHCPVLGVAATLRSHTTQCLVWPRRCAPTLPSAWHGRDVALPHRPVLGVAMTLRSHTAQCLVWPQNCPHSWCSHTRHPHPWHPHFEQHAQQAVAFVLVAPCVPMVGEVVENLRLTKAAVDELREARLLR
eukprot:366387-Chlamydomonas_euryale.AAC.30